MRTKIDIMSKQNKTHSFKCECGKVADAVLLVATNVVAGGRLLKDKVHVCEYHAFKAAKMLKEQNLSSDDEFLICDLRG